METFKTALFLLLVIVFVNSEDAVSKNSTGAVKPKTTAWSLFGMKVRNPEFDVEIISTNMVNKMQKRIVKMIEKAYSEHDDTEERGKSIAKQLKAKYSDKYNIQIVINKSIWCDDLYLKTEVTDPAMEDADKVIVCLERNEF